MDPARWDTARRGVFAAARGPGFREQFASFEVDLTAISGTVLNGGRKLTSDHGGEDLVLTNGSFVVSETLRPASLTLLKGATIVPEHTWAATSYPPVRISSPGQVRIACGAGIDVTGRGYLDDTIYPGVELPSGNRTGGSHLGEGGVVFGTPGETFGSVYRPLENGGTTNNGWQGLNSGGVVRIETESLVLDAGAAILANGAAAYGGIPTSAGGSVWITADTLWSRFHRSEGRRVRKGILIHRWQRWGWGDRDRVRGAVRGHFELVRASGGGRGRDGGAGTIYLKGPDSTFGDLLVDNDWIDGRWTILPTLGTGRLKRSMVLCGW